MINIYKITNKITNKAYIGASKSNIRKIKNMHKSIARRKYNAAYSPSVNYAIYKEGINNFKWEIIAQVPNKYADYYETYYISLFNTFNEGYNTTIDGKPHTKYETELMRMGRWPVLIQPEIKNLYMWYLLGVVVEDE